MKRSGPYSSRAESFLISSVPSFANETSLQLFARPEGGGWLERLVGAGITAASGHPDPDTRRLLDDALRAWGATHWPALQAEAVAALIVDGEALIIMRAGPAGLELRHIPVEQLDETLTIDLGHGRYVAGGVEYGADDRPIAYHISPGTPGFAFCRHGTSGPR